MARRPRYLLAGQPQHVAQRGVNCGAIVRDDDDRRFLCDCLADAAGRHACAVHAWCLMTNHLHLLVSDPRFRVK